MAIKNITATDVDGIISATGGNSTNWNTAYGWGNHAAAGYLTSFDITTQTDPKYLRSDVDDTASGNLTLQDVNITNGKVLRLYRSSGSAHQRVDARLDGTDQARLHWYGKNDAQTNTGFKHAWYDGANYINVTASSPGVVTFDATTPVIKIDGAQHAGLQIDRGSTSYDANLMFQTAGSTKFRLWMDAVDALGIRDEANATEMVTFKSGGNVGIGTTSPSAKMHVYDVSTDILTQSTTGAARNILKSSTGEWRLGTNAGQSNNFWIYEPTLAQYVFNINTSGNVGIGTTSPSGKLHIKPDASSEFIFTGASTSGYATTFHMDNTGLDIGHNSTARSLNLKTGSLDRLTITGAGNVGIGTTSPGHVLHVQRGGGFTADTNFATGVYSYNNSGAGISASGMLVQAGWYNDNTTEIARFSALTSGYAQVQRMVIKSNGNVGIGATSPNAKLDVNGGGNFSGGVVTSGVDSAYTGVAIPKGAYLKSNDGSYLRNIIGHNSSGNIEIGHAGTSLISDIQLKPGSSGNVTFYSSGSEDMRINSSGNVGIGTTSPASKLHVTGTGSGTFRAESTSSDYPIRISGHQTTADAYIGVDQSNKLKFYVNSADRMVINSSGNVGIGTTSPSASLHIEKTGDQTSSVKGVVLSSGAAGTNKYLPSITWSYGASGTPDFARLEVQRGAGTGGRMLFSVANTSGTMTESMRISEAGNVGIGTTTPAQKLDVRGNATFGDGSGITNIYADNAYTLAGFNAATFDYSYADGNLLANPATGQVTWLGSAFLSGNITQGVIPQGAAAGLSDTGLQDNINGPGGYAGLLGGGISYRDPSQPFAPAGYPDIGTSAAIGGFVTYGSITSHTGAGSQDGAAFSSSFGTGDVAKFEGPATFTYRYGSDVLAVDPVGMQFAAFDFLGASGEMRFDPNAGALFAPSFSPTSDKKLKDNITPINNGLDVVTKLSGKEYDWKSNGKKSSGFIAQDVEEVIPHAVTANSDTLTLNYNAIIAYQNEAIKELKGMIDELKQEIEILKNK